MTSAPTIRSRIDHVAAAVKPSKAFMVVDGAVFTYGQALDRIGRLCGYFRDRLSPEDTLGIMTRSPVDAACLLLAALRAGYPVIPLNPDLTPPETRVALGAAKVDHLFVDRSILDSAPLPAGIAATSIAEDAGGGLFARLLGKPKAGADPAGLHARLAETAPETPSDPGDPEGTAMLLFTSGTTDRAKVVELSRANLAAQFDILDRVYDYDSASRLLNPLPMHFTDGIVHGPLATFFASATLVRPRVFRITELEALLDTIHRERITHLIAVPTLLALIQRLTADQDDTFATADFRYVRSSGDRLPPALWRSFQERFGVRVMNSYGLSETVCEALFCGPAETDIRIGSIGRPVGCEIDIVGETGNSLANGLTGELLIRGGLTMKGYLDRPDLTAEAFSGDWLRTGDLAVRSADGFVSIEGRRKNTIVTGGMNVDPEEVADILCAHSDIAEAAACGLPDAVMGEVVAAAVVPRAGAAPPEPGALTALCRDGLAEHKRPRRIAVLLTLPRTDSGKLQLPALREAIVDVDRKAAPEAGDLEGRIIEMAGEIFGLPPERLSRASTPETAPGWDSFAHISLSMAVESMADIRLSPREILAVASLGDLIEIVGNKFER